MKRITLRDRSAGRRMQAARNVEMLESRTLLSGWGTIDSYQLASGKTANAYAMTADSAGNVYAAGGAVDSAGVLHGNIREKASGASTWTTIADVNYPGGNGTWFNGLAIDTAGDMYVSGGTNNGHWLVLERPAGQTAFSTVDDYLSGGYSDGVAVDGAGNVIAVGLSQPPGGQYTWTVRRQTGGQGAFAIVDTNAVSGGLNVATGVTTIASGPNAGIYVSGNLGTTSRWTVRKSTNGGSTWSTVDSFQYDTNSNGDHAWALTADAAGNLVVAGSGSKGVITGGTKKNPTYTYTPHWLARESADGGVSWSTIDDYVLSSATTHTTTAYAVGTDLAGNFYTAGQAAAADGTFHSIIRSNAAGTWTTIDDYQIAVGKTAINDAFAVDPAGTLYVGGKAADSSGAYHWIVRSAAGPSAPALAAAAVFSSAQITSPVNLIGLSHPHHRHA